MERVSEAKLVYGIKYEEGENYDIPFREPKWYLVAFQSVLMNIL